MYEAADAARQPSNADGSTAGNGVAVSLASNPMYEAGDAARQPSNADGSHVVFFDASLIAGSEGSDANKYYDVEAPEAAVYATVADDDINVYA
jgi:hypothetical protein